MKDRHERVRIFQLALVLFSFLVVNGLPRVNADPQYQTADSAQADWSQFGNTAARTNFAPQIVDQQVSFAWDWNSAGKDGRSQSDHLMVPDLVQPIAGGNQIYMVANNTVFALDEASGTVLWQTGDIGSLNATPVYYDQAIYVGSENGSLYQLNAGNGEVIGKVDLGGAISTAPVLADSMVIVTIASGSLAAIDPTTLHPIWKYEAGGELATMPAYSAAHRVVVVVGKDLYVHGVDVTSGRQKWRVKPTVRNFATENEETNYAAAENGWPVIAEQHGVVFIRYRLEWNTLWALGEYPTTNADIRAALIANPQEQALFALSLDTGKTAFVPAVGNGGPGDGGMLEMGPLPVIRQVDGQEVAYIIWRNGQTCPNCDGREDANMGEMVLDDQTMSGYQAGDVRFVQFDDIQTDEMISLSMIGDILFHGHWLVNEGRRITDRSTLRGDQFENPILTSDGLYVIWRQCDCPKGQSCNPVLYPGGSGTTVCGVSCPFDETTRYCANGLFSYGDQRRYPSGFYQYHNDIQHTQSKPFTIASGNMLIMKTDDGGLMAFRSGNSRSQSVDPIMVSNPILRTDNQPWKLVTIEAKDAMQHVGEVVRVCGTINSVVDHLPKAVYMSFTMVHDGQMMVRIFQKDLHKFNYDVKSLYKQNICVSGLMRLYYPEMNAPEIIVDDPRAIVVN
jgi:outer membrane protein assembly factor BamB